MSENIEQEDCKFKGIEGFHSGNSSLMTQSSHSITFSLNSYDCKEANRLNFNREISKGVLKERSNQR